MRHLTLILLLSLCFSPIFAQRGSRMEFTGGNGNIYFSPKDKLPEEVANYTFAPPYRDFCFGLQFHKHFNSHKNDTIRVSRHAFSAGLVLQFNFDALLFSTYVPVQYRYAFYMPKAADDLTLYAVAGAALNPLAFQFVMVDRWWEPDAPYYYNWDFPKHFFVYPQVGISAVYTIKRFCINADLLMNFAIPEVMTHKFSIRQDDGSYSVFKTRNKSIGVMFKIGLGFDFGKK